MINEMTKRFITLTGLSVGALFSYVSILCLIVGFLIAKLAGGKETGMPGRFRSIVIPMGEHKLHLHHWLFFSLMMFGGLAENIFHYVPPEVFFGMLAGLAWQGIYCYEDWHHVVYRIPEIG